jgi:hypothetical protein
MYPLNSSKIVPRILGGLGNQLFCYAAARRLALISDAELVIDDVSGFVHDHVYRRKYQLHHFSIPCRKARPAERFEPFPLILRYLKRRLNQRLPFVERHYIQQVGVDFDPRLLHVKPRGTVYLEGYWQSEDYFKDMEETIREDLRIIPPTDSANLEMAARIKDCLAVAVHVRFFDAPNDAGINNTPVNYYTRAVHAMEAIAPDVHYFVFSDQPEFARASLALPDERVTFVSHNQGDENAYADLWLMIQCQHFIIANSTFSWWGAWLAKHAGKHVIAPGFEMRQGKMSWGFDGLLPKEWIKL